MRRRAGTFCSVQYHIPMRVSSLCSAKCLPLMFVFSNIYYLSVSWATGQMQCTQENDKANGFIGKDCIALHIMKSA